MTTSPTCYGCDNLLGAKNLKYQQVHQVLVIIRQILETLSELCGGDETGGRQNRRRTSVREN
jgi:hypothetical protein